MKQNEFQTKIDSITKKIGDEASNLVLDDIGILLNDNAEMNKSLEAKDKEIESLKQRNEMLQNVNGGLLQQVTVAHIEEKPNDEKPREKYDIKKSFNKKGEFI